MAGGGNRELGELLMSLLSSPEIVGKVLTAFGGSREEGESPQPDAEEASAVSIDVGSETGGEERAEKAKDGARREKLLCALRPYLSEERGRRLDALIRLSPMLRYLHSEDHT